MTEFVRSTAVPHLEARRSCQENSCYRPHAHEFLSLGVIDAGSSEFGGAHGRRATLVPGDVIVIGAHDVHQCNPSGGSWRYQMVHMDPRWVSDLVSGPRERALLSGITLLRRPDLHARATAWIDLIAADAPAAEIASGLRGLLVELGTAPAIRFDGADTDTDATLREALAPVLDRLRDDEVNPRVSELAEQIGMSEFQLVRAVKQVTGLSPLAWRQNERVSKARRLLRDGASIADTAVALGFTDQSHFHRVFRGHVATSPGRYRA